MPLFESAQWSCRSACHTTISHSERLEGLVIEAVCLKADEEPAEQKHLLIQWKPGEGMRTEHNGGSMIQFVPEHLWGFWQTEGPALATRVGLSKVYYRGRPGASNG